MAFRMHGMVDITRGICEYGAQHVKPRKYTDLCLFCTIECGRCTVSILAQYTCICPIYTATNAI